jgi:hypothetical protein
MRKRAQSAAAMPRLVTKRLKIGRSYWTCRASDLAVVPFHVSCSAGLAFDGPFQQISARGDVLMSIPSILPFWMMPCGTYGSRGRRHLVKRKRSLLMATSSL